MSTLHDHLAQIERNGAAAFGATSLAHGHSSVTRTVRRHRTTRAAVTAVAGVGVVGAGSWGAIAAFGGAETLAPGAIVSPSTDSTAVAPSSTAPSVSAEPGGPAQEITVIAGHTNAQHAQRLADSYDIDVERALSAIEHAVDTLVPEATSAEGWVVDGVLDATNAPSVEDAADQLVAARVQQLTDLGVPRDEWQTVITKASMVEREAKLPEDKPKIARVIENRLALDMKLELDSTVKFYSTTEDVFTTQEERETDSPYNTYKNAGLPPGAIATPSLEAIQAVVAPAEGDWLFFVTVNLQTGETAYASTFEGHQDNVAILQEWIAANQ